MKFALDDQIVAQPAEVARLLDTEVPRLNAERPLVFTGIGTSLHAARVAAAWVWLLFDGHVRATAIDAHDLALIYPLTPVDQVVVISHRGYKRYPRAALDRARAADAATVAVVGADAPDQNADLVLRTCANETAGTFTVSYLSSLAVLAALTANLGGPNTDRFVGALNELPAALRSTVEAPAPVEVGRRCADGEPLLLTGFDLDAITAAEAALKIKEGARIWTEAMSTEFGLHGTPAAFKTGMNVISLTPGTDDQGRTATLRGLLAKLDANVVTCGDTDEDLWFAHTDPWLRPFTSIVPLQRLTAELARVRGTNPDTLHGDVEPWRSTMTTLEL
jgi:glucosamine--fructose-6-phosphate aminotransferase (isomerizing)